MEKLNEILNNIKERFTNPFLFSFICSWLIFNWQIIVALLWYDTTQIEREGYPSIYAFIRAKSDIPYSVSYPLFFALGYTFAMPIIKNLILAFNSWSSKWGTEWNFKILKNGKISITKYLKLRVEYDKRTKVLEEIISKESTLIESYNTLNTELLSTKNQLNDVRQQVTKSETEFGKLKDLNILNGEWTNTYAYPNGTSGSEQIFIQYSKYYIKSTFGSLEHKFDIQDFYYNTRTEEVFFIKELAREQKTTKPTSEYLSINRLKFHGKDLLIGTENEVNRIEYKRK
jgi:hypothetical protein